MSAKCALISLVLVSALASEARAEDTYFPLEVGNTWVYAYQDSAPGHEFRWEVLERAGDIAVIDRPGREPSSANLTLREAGSDIEWEVPGEGFRLFYRFVNGSSWVRHDPNICDDGREVAVLLETESVVTPAGTFDDCLRIEVREGSRCVDAGTAIEWWAPRVGLVKLIEANFTGSGGLMTLELKAYSLESGEAGDLGSRVIPSDCNADGQLDLSDGVCLLGYLFEGVPAELPCGDGSAADPANSSLLDSNADGEVDLSDAVQVFSYLFVGGAPPILGTTCVPISGCPEVCPDEE